MTAPTYPAALAASTWTACLAPHKAGLAKARIKADLADTLKALARAQDAVDWDLLGTEGLATVEDAMQRRADLDDERAGRIKAVLKLAERARGEARPLVAAFKADAALKDEPARLAGDVVAAAQAYAGAVDDAVAAAVKAIEKQRLALAAAAKPAAEPAVDAKQARLAAMLRARLIAGLRAVRQGAPGQPPMQFLAGLAAADARVLVGPNLGPTHKAQLLALLPEQEGVKWIKGECMWEEKAVTFVCANPPSGAARRLQRAILEQTKAKLAVRVRKPVEEAEAGTAPPPAPDAGALKARRVAGETLVRGRIGALMPAIGQVRDEARRRAEAAQAVKLKQALAKLGALDDKAAIEALRVMLKAVEAQQARLGTPGAARPAKPGPRPLDLSDPTFAREVMALYTPEERARFKTKADFDSAVANYHTVMALRKQMPMPARLQLTPVTVDIHAPAVVEERARAAAQCKADKAFLRDVYKARGLDPNAVDDMDENEVEAAMWQFREAARLEGSALANDALGDSKGAVNHFLDGVEDGLGKTAHDVGNIGLAAKFAVDAASGDDLPEEPEWFGAAGRTRGQNQSVAELGWELAGNIPIIGKAQLLKGATDLARGVRDGDWNNVAYGLGNMAGSAMAGQVLDKAPLPKGRFSDTRLGRVVERVTTPMKVDRVGPDAIYRSKMPSGMEIEIQPHQAGTKRYVNPDLAHDVHTAARSVDALLPRGRRVAEAGKPLKVVVDPTNPIPEMKRSTGAVHMPPNLDTGRIPLVGAGSELRRWGPKKGDARPSEVVMQHELGHAAMPEIGARLDAISGRKKARAMMKLLGLSKSPEEQLKDARLAREDMLVNGLDELGADTIGVAAAKDLQAMPKSVAAGVAQGMAAKARDPKMELPGEFPKNPVEWMRRRDFSDGGTIPGVHEDVTAYDVFSGVRRHLGQRYGDALTGSQGPKVIAALMAANEQFLKKLDAEPGLLDGDYVSANALFVSLFDAEAARLGLAPKPVAVAP